MTQRDVALALGKPPSYVAKIEGRARRLDLVEFIAFSRALGIEDAALFTSISEALRGRLEI